MLPSTSQRIRGSIARIQESGIKECVTMIGKALWLSEGDNNMSTIFSFRWVTSSGIGCGADDQRGCLRLD